ncbi:formate-tetrahydrofolate ligase [Bartonella koehlerae C-29]|uniref:Formate-tetrahydrofolate ligase n=1 Tax=Bartonella koehlerae C-29 TaxID=1134510 RepID=A0A067W7B0_9HYPH|nr:formate-tetrahydrofolate ligase [Bartonella koehlerae C-29]
MLYLYDKTPYSFSSDPTQYDALFDFEIPVREVHLLASAGFCCHHLRRYHYYAWFTVFPYC